jgi:hypothetical protein
MERRTLARLRTRFQDKEKLPNIRCSGRGCATSERVPMPGLERDEPADFPHLPRH